MHLTGRRPVCLPAFLVSLSIAALANPSEPTPTATPEATSSGREIHLGEYAARATLDRTGTEGDDGAVVITNDTITRLAARGALTTVSPGGGARVAAPTSVPSPRTAATPSAARRSYWQRKVDAQRDAIAEAQEDVARLTARIEALEDAAFQGGRRATRLWAQVEETKGLLRVAQRRLARERDRLDAIIRQARREGAEPGWFR